jgi:hypothetical protein
MQSHVFRNFYYVLLKMNDEKIKKNRVELKVEQKQAIIEYRQKYPNKKQTELCEYFGKLFKVKIPPTTMSGILSVTSRNRIARLDDFWPEKA